MKDGRFVFNLDESGSSIRGMTLGGCEKCIVKREGPANTKNLTFRGCTDHVTLMPVVSATGQVYTPVVVLPGKQARYSRRNSTIETPIDFFPSPCHLFMREKAGVDTQLFFEWAGLFDSETRLLREDGQS